MLDEWVYKPRQRRHQPRKVSLPVKGGNDAVEVTAIFHEPHWLPKRDMSCRIL